MARIWGRTIPGGWRQCQLDQQAIKLSSLRTAFATDASSCAEEKAEPTDAGPEQELDSQKEETRDLESRELETGGGVVLQSAEIDGSQRWVMLGALSTSVRQNGLSVELGLAVLDDQDEILVHSDGTNARFYFSSEQLAAVVPAPAGISSPCPRCKTAVVAGSPVVQCGACQAWHHQRQDRPCWTYTDLCAACHRQETALDGQLSWTPDHL